MQSIIGWRDTQAATPIASIATEWKPEALPHEQWPPDYDAVYRWRARMLSQLLASPEMLASAKSYYSTRPAQFIMHWMDTYDPRKQENHDVEELRGPKWMPFVFFLKQDDLVQFLEDLNSAQESGLIEKSRDMGATWVCCGYSVWAFLFKDDDSTGWGSRKEDLVDKLGDPDSIFEKMRLIMRRMPQCFMPDGWNWSRHNSFMKLVNPSNGSTITGEAGDNIGRGGRKSRYFKDEAAHYERPEKIESALGDNTNVQIDISSVNGLGNVFHRRREHGLVWSRGAKLPRGYVRVLVMDWRDHPNKTQEWYDARRAKYEREGMAHVFAQEVDRNYSAAVSNTVIPYLWIQAAKDAHIHIPYVAEAYAKIKDSTGWFGGLDIADEGNDRNSYSEREWIIWRHCEEWGERDPAVSARRAIAQARNHRNRINVMYDSIGLGASVKGEYNRLVQDDKIITESEVPFVPWNAGASVLNPFNRIIPDDDESLLNKDFFENLKAQGWWSLRTRFYKTWKAKTEGVLYDPDELISMDSTMPLYEQICKELAQPTTKRSSKLKLLIDKNPPGTKSPNNGDSGMMMYFPLDLKQEVLVGKYG